MGFSFNSKKHNQDSRRSPQSFVKRQTCDLKVSKCGSLTTSDLPLNRLPWSWQATNQPSFLKDTGLGQNHGISEAPASTSFIHPGFVVTNLHDYMYIYNYVYIYIHEFDDDDHPHFHFHLSSSQTAACDYFCWHHQPSLCFHHLAPSDFLPETPNAAPRASPHFQLNSILTWPPPTPKCSEPARKPPVSFAQELGVWKSHVVGKPRKINIEPKHVGLEDDDIFFSIGWFFGFHVNFQGFFEEQNLVAFVYSKWPNRSVIPYPCIVWVILRREMWPWHAWL